LDDGPRDIRIPGLKPGDLDFMVVVEIWRYPVKSMAGEPLKETTVGLQGLPGDRIIHVRDGHGHPVSARSYPALLSHRAALGSDGEPLVDGRPWSSLPVRADVEKAVGPGAQLVRSLQDDRFDILPLLVATDGAIEAFGYDGRRLRPNLVIGGVEGLTERGWEGRKLRIGRALISLADLRERCIMTTVDPDTGVRDLSVLRKIRREFGGRLALNAWAQEEGDIRVGDQAELL
jgi:uncharacterized protein YcbX